MTACTYVANIYYFFTKILLTICLIGYHFDGFFDNDLEMNWLRKVEFFKSLQRVLSILKCFGLEFSVKILQYRHFPQFEHLITNIFEVIGNKLKKVNILGLRLGFRITFLNCR